MQIRLGIIGLGAMGAEMLEVATRHPAFSVRRACDRDPGVLDRLQRPGVEFGTDATAVVEASDVDAVYIATPPHSHASLAVAALRSGKAVFCEKPLAITIPDGERMLAAAARSGLAAAVNFALSDRHAVRDIERRLKAGEAGQLLGVDIRLRFPRWPRDFQSGAAWLAGRDEGGFVREVFSHFAYLTDRLVGPLRPVQVSVDRPDPAAAESSARGLLRSGETPVHLSAHAGVAGPKLYEWVLYGSRQSYLLRNWGELLVSDGGDWTPVSLDGDIGSETTRLSLFADAIHGRGSTDLADFATAFRVQQVVEAFHA